ncbi:chaperone NapD [Microbulbifer aggregans]|uniref:chaperone NapD n=1 Tax=Microbulbifer aggregans TaxID=1769779 RepID=UPI001CFD6A9F|nr:chaperone NapD [Microbulbifer aggregans]
MSCSQSEASDDKFLHVVSLVAHVRPEHLAAVGAWVDTQPAMDIQISTPEGKLVLLMEAGDHFEINDGIADIRDLPGVVNVVMVYHREMPLAEAGDLLVESAADTQPVKIVGDE